MPSMAPPTTCMLNLVQNNISWQEKFDILEMGKDFRTEFSDFKKE